MQFAWMLNLPQRRSNVRGELLELRVKRSRWIHALKSNVTTHCKSFRPTFDSDCPTTYVIICWFCWFYCTNLCEVIRAARPVNSHQNSHQCVFIILHRLTQYRAENASSGCQYIYIYIYIIYYQGIYIAFLARNTYTVKQYSFVLSNLMLINNAHHYIRCKQRIGLSYESALHKEYR